MQAATKEIGNFFERKARPARLLPIRSSRLRGSHPIAHEILNIKINHIIFQIMTPYNFPPQPRKIGHSKGFKEVILVLF